MAAELDVIMKSLEKLEGVLSATSEKADGELKSLGKVSADTKAALDNLGIQQREFADRLTALEQKGVQTAPAEPLDNSWGAQLVKASSFGDFVGGRAQKCRVEVKNTLTGSDTNVAPDRRPGIVPGAFQMLTIEGLLNSTTTTSNAVEFNHDWDMPIGKWDVAREDDHGLWVEGTLTPGLSLSEDVKAALGHGTIDGLSIGGYLKRGDYEETEEGRRITKWTSLMEVSPVVFPADASARIDLSSVKSGDMLALIDGIESVRDFEHFLRDAGGLTKGAALALTARAKEVLTARDSQPEPTDVKALAQVAERLQRMTAAFR